MLFVGCESFKRNYLQEPKAELKEVKVTNAGLSAATLLFVLEIKNPNKSALDIGDVSYQTFLDNKFFSEAKVDRKYTIPAQGAALVELPLPVEYSKIAGGLARVLKGEEVEYRIKGDARFSLFKVPFDKTGKLKMKD